MIRLKIHNLKLQDLQAKPTPITILITRVFRSKYIIEYIQSNQKNNPNYRKKEKQGTKPHFYVWILSVES
jgi:hypothetical protein